MALTGSLQLIAGLAFLGVVIALCLWLLNRLFPGPAGVSHSSQSNAAPAAFRAQHSTAASEHRQRETSGIAQAPGSRNEGHDERKR
jgi:hypothetical protein